jgi:hypothetical protein
MLEALDLPPALRLRLCSLFPDERLALRALMAPWPDLGFHSIWEERALWLDPVPGERRRAFERLLEAERGRFDLSVPYFVSPGTDGTLRSPYAELSDAEYWLYVVLWGTEAHARLALERWSVELLGGKTTLEYLREARRPGWTDRLRHLWQGPREDPRRVAWNAQRELMFPVYS